jgi:hypothetical protein
MFTLFMEINIVYCANYTENIDTLYRQNTEFLVLKYVVYMATTLLYTTTNLKTFKIYLFVQTRCQYIMLWTVTENLK